MDFNNQSDPEQIRSVSREEFYKDKITISKFHKLFDSINPDFKDMSFYDKYCWTVDKTGVELEVWGAIKYIPMSNLEPWVTYEYSVSTFGNIESHKSNKPIVLQTYDDGYKYCFLGKLYVNTQRAVLSTFGWEIEHKLSKNKLTVNHKNKIRSDNKLHNLEWMTGEENTKDANRNSPPIRITVVKECVGIEIGTVFYLSRRSDVDYYGISPTRFKERIRNAVYPYGLSIEKIESVGDNKPGLSEALVEYLKLKIN